MLTVKWYIYFWLYQIYLLPKYFKYKKKFKNGEDVADEIAPLVMRWAQNLVKITKSTVEVIGAENVPEEGNVVFVANHQSNFDTPLFLGYIPRAKGFIAKKETDNLPVVSNWMKFINCVFIDRDNPREAIKAILKGAKIVKSGYALVIFPEGTRSADGSLDEFKPGSLKLAVKGGAKIIPVTIDGSIDIMKKGSNRIKKASVKMIVSEPVEAIEDTIQLAEDIKSIIQKNLDNKKTH